MKSKNFFRMETSAVVLGLALLTSFQPITNAFAQGTVRYEAQPSGSKMKMEGTSSIHDWDMQSAVLGGFMEADAKFPESALTDPKAAQPKVEVSIPVRSFKSNDQKMDARMQKEMKEPQFKKIEYKLIELKPKSTAGATGALKFDATGALTIAGKTKTNSIPVTIEKMTGNKIKVAGSTSVKMTDYGIEPPSLIPGLGVFTTGDSVKLTFEWVLAQKAQ